MPKTRSLDDLQKWLQAVITHPKGVTEGIASSYASQFVDVSSADIGRVILPSQQMSSLERLQIYGSAYFGRLIECLRVQFPSLHHAIGDAAFDGLAFGYLIQHPSESYTLGTLGHAFDAYLTSTRPPRAESEDPEHPDFADFLIDLARLERTYNEVFDGPGPERSRSLQPSDFEGISPERFADCRLVVHACVRLLELRFPVHEYASAIRQGTQPSPPIARPVWLVVTRRDFVVRREEITRQQYDLLSALSQRATIGESLQILIDGSNTDVSSLLANLRTWFHNWSATPLFAELIRGNSDD